MVETTCDRAGKRKLGNRLQTGMAKTGAMTRNQNHDDASSMKMIKTCDNSGVVPWSELNHDVLLLVMMKTGLADYFAFGGVCTSWRSLALSNKSKFMASRSPMSICISTNADRNECSLQDIEGRKFKTILPLYADRTCIGVTCGYLVLFGEKSKDFLLVNPITRHELHFPMVPFDYRHFGESFRAILVFSPLLSEWVFVLLKRPHDEIWFSITGKREWNHVSTSSHILDLHYFKGKIYAVDFNNCLSEVTLYPTTKVTLLEIKNLPEPGFLYPVLVSSGENLYVMNRFLDYPYKIQEINISKMEWVSREKIGEEYAFFCSKSESGDAVIRVESWAHIHSQHRRYTSTGTSGKQKFFNAKMWYFFHECLDVNLLHE